MNLIKLFFPLSCVSAAFVSTVSRSLAAEFSLKRGQNGAELAEFRMPMSLPKMPSFPNLLPIALCDNLPVNPGSNNFLNTAIIPNLNQYKLDSESELLSWREYERLLVDKNFFGISEAFKRNSIDFSYVPRTRDFFRVILDRRCIEGDEIMKNYFESGVIDEMVEFGFTSYQDIIESAMNNESYFIANLALDRLIAKHRPVMNSPNFKSKPSNDPIRQTIIVEKCYNPRFDPIRTGFEPHSNCIRTYDIEFNFDCNNLDPKDIEKFNFYKKYYYIFKNTSKREEWSAFLSRKTIHLKFLNCYL